VPRSWPSFFHSRPSRLHGDPCRAEHTETLRSDFEDAQGAKTPKERCICAVCRPALIRLTL
jgi:hypothetical protein